MNAIQGSAIAKDSVIPIPVLFVCVVLYCITSILYYIILYYIVLYYIVLYNHKMKESPEEVVQSVKLSLASVDKANHGKFPINIFVNLG